MSILLWLLGLKCKVYRRGSPAWVWRFLVRIGNRCNDSATATTVFEKWRACMEIIPVWERKKKSMGWDKDTLPACVVDQHKFACVQAIRGGWFSTYATFEVTRVTPAFSKQIHLTD